MADTHHKRKVRVGDRDVLIVPTTKRDPNVDAAFRIAFEAVRERNIKRVQDLRARRAA